MKKLLILVIVVIVAVVAWWMLAGNQPAGEPASDTTATEGDQSSASIAGDLDGLTDADLDAEFKVVDSDAAKL